MNRIDTAWRPSTWFVWWTAIRPRTLGMSVAPVAFGTALALADGGGLDWAVLAATLACALLIQIGTNLYNDAADYERGTDTPDRRGPTRVTLAGWASAGSVKRGAALCLGVALAIGAGLVAVGGWPILAIGCASLVAAWGYSGGPRPISHTPLGEVFVLAFFGVFAVAGSHWLQSPQLSWRDLVGGLAVGAPAAAVLLVNNFRDLETDRRSGRRTLAAVLGPRRSRFAYAAFVLAPFAAFATLALLALGEDIHTIELVVFVFLIGLALKEAHDGELLVQERSHQALQHGMVCLVAQHSFHRPIKTNQICHFRLIFNVKLI